MGEVKEYCEINVSGHPRNSKVVKYFRESVVEEALCMCSIILVFFFAATNVETCWPNPEDMCWGRLPAKSLDFFGCVMLTRSPSVLDSAVCLVTCGTAVFTGTLV